VCEALLRYGPLTLAEVRTHTQMSKKDATNALIVLVQHSFASALLREELSLRALVAHHVYKV